MVNSIVCVLCSPNRLLDGDHFIFFILSLNPPLLIPMELNQFKPSLAFPKENLFSK